MHKNERVEKGVKNKPPDKTCKKKYSKKKIFKKKKKD